MKLWQFLWNSTAVVYAPPDEGAGGGSGGGDGGDGGGSGDLDASGALGSSDGGDGGSGGDGGDGGQGGDGGNNSPGDWVNGFDGVDDDLKAMVGNRDPKAFLTWVKAQRQAATRAGKERDALRLPEEGANAEAYQEFFANFKPEDTTPYLDMTGLDEDKLSPAQRHEIEAAHAAGIHPEQYRAMLTAREANVTGEFAQGIDAAIERNRERWGDKAELNGQLTDRAAKSLGLPPEFLTAVFHPLAGLNASLQDGLVDGLLKIGLFMKEGGPLDGGGSGDMGGSDTLDQQISTLEEKAVAGNLTPSDQKRLDVLLTKRVEAQHGSA